MSRLNDDVGLLPIDPIARFRDAAGRVGFELSDIEIASLGIQKSTGVLASADDFLEGKVTPSERATVNRNLLEAARMLDAGNDGIGWLAGSERKGPKGSNVYPPKGKEVHLSGGADSQPPPASKPPTDTTALAAALEKARQAQVPPEPAPAPPTIVAAPATAVKDDEPGSLEAAVLRFTMPGSKIVEISANPDDWPRTLHATGHVPHSAVMLNPNQPRQFVDDEFVGDLAASLTEGSTCPPIVVCVRSTEEREESNPDVLYRTIAGEHRWIAHELAQIPLIEITVREPASPQEEFLAALIDNNTSPLTDVDRALAVAKVAADFNLNSVAAIAKKVGYDQPLTAALMHIASLPDEVHAFMHPGRKTAERLKRQPAVALAKFTLIPSIKVQLAKRMLAEVGMKNAGTQVRWLHREAEQYGTGGDGASRRRSPKEALALINSLLSAINNRRGVLGEFKMSIPDWLEVIQQSYGVDHVLAELREASERLQRFATIIETSTNGAEASRRETLARVLPDTIQVDYLDDAGKVRRGEFVDHRTYLRLHDQKKLTWRKFGWKRPSDQPPIGSVRDMLSANKLQ